MELVKANLHMERSKCQVSTQVTLEEDKNISDRNPDASAILLERAEVAMDEIRPGKDLVVVRGRLVYEILIRSQEDEGRMYCLQGEISFEEKIRAEGLEAIDHVEVYPQIEDLRAGLINSRKISIRALLQFGVSALVLYDEEIPVGLTGAEGMEVQKELLSQSVLAVERKDILRIKEELELPANMPPVQEVLWKSLELGKWEIRTLEDSIGMQGEIRLFLFYEGEGEGRSIKSFSTTIPFSQNLECPGSRSTMLSEIVPKIASGVLGIKEDYDGESRMLEVEMVLDLPIRLLENREWEILTDAYGTTKEVTPVYTKGYRKMMQDKQQGRIKLSQVFSVPSSGGKILQVCHVESSLLPQEVIKSERGLEVEGAIAVTILYMTEDEEKAYESIKGEIPYSYLAENVSLTEESYWNIVPALEILTGTLLDSENIEIKAIVGLEITLGKRWQQPTLSGLQVQPFQPEKLREMPGIVVYFPGKEESVWEVGKKYLTPLDSIRSLNQLSSDTLQKGQKILIVKEVN